MRVSVIVPQSMQHLVEGKPKLFSSMPPVFPDVLSSAEENLRVRTTRMDCVRASEQCLKEQACSTKYRTMRQCVAGGKESNFSSVAGLEAKDECRSAMDALKQSPLYNCRCKRGMKKEKNCLRIYWGIYQTLQGNISSVKVKNKQTNSIISSGYDWKLSKVATSDAVFNLLQNETMELYCSFPGAIIPRNSLRGYCLGWAARIRENPAAIVNIILVLFFSEIYLAPTGRDINSMFHNLQTSFFLHPEGQAHG